MKILRLLPICLMAFLLWGCGKTSDETVEVIYGTESASDTVVPAGVFIDSIDVSGMTRDEVKAAVNAYLEELGNEDIVLTCGDDVYTVKAGSLSPTWVNEYILDDVFSLKSGDNAVQRYKAYRDLLNGGASFELYVALDAAAVWEYLSSLQIPNLNYEDAVVAVQMRFYTEYKQGNNVFELPLFETEEAEPDTEL